MYIWQEHSLTVSPLTRFSSTPDVMMRGTCCWAMTNNVMTKNETSCIHKDFKSPYHMSLRNPPSGTTLQPPCFYLFSNIWKVQQETKSWFCRESVKAKCAISKRSRVLIINRVRLLHGGLEWKTKIWKWVWLRVSENPQKTTGPGGGRVTVSFRIVLTVGIWLRNFTWALNWVCVNSIDLMQLSAL